MLKVVSLNESVKARSRREADLKEMVEALTEENEQLKTYFEDGIEANDVLSMSLDKIQNVIVIGRRLEDDGLYIATSNSNMVRNLHLLTLCRLVLEQALMSQHKVSFKTYDEDK